MKQIITILFLAVFQLVNAQEKTAIKNDNKINKAFVQQSGVVTTVNVFAANGFAKGCTNDIKEFTFYAYITTNGPCTVQYQWERSDGGIDGYAPRTIEFKSAGTQQVVQTWTLSLPEYEGWQTVKVTAPNTVVSKPAYFKIICCNTSSGDDCTTNPFFISSCTKSLISTFGDLAKGDGVRNCHPTLNYPTVSGIMKENCFGFQTNSTLNVSYSTFYTPGSNEWRVIWGSQASNFSYYGACPPSPIVFPHPGVAENHVFAAKFIRKSDYQSFTGVKSYSTMTTVPAIFPADVAEILTIGIEEGGGYIESTEPADYKNPLSSKGIVVTLKMKDGSSAECYVINNYDKAGTLTWKEKNPNCK